MKNCTAQEIIDGEKLKIWYKDLSINVGNSITQILILLITKVEIDSKCLSTLVSQFHKEQYDLEIENIDSVSWVLSDYHFVTNRVEIKEFVKSFEMAVKDVYRNTVNNETMVNKLSEGVYIFTANHRILTCMSKQMKFNN